MTSLKCPVFNEARTFIHINTQNLTSSSEDFKLVFFPVAQTAYSISSHLRPVETTSLKLESYTEKDTEKKVNHTEEFQCMIASENVLANEWNTPEEDEAWAHL
jgi:hypothetical protein